MDKQNQNRTQIQRRVLQTFNVTPTEKRIDTDYYVEGYATTFDQPYLLFEYGGQKYYERISSDALVGADMSDVIMQYNHEGKVLARQSNKTLGIEPDAHGLFIYADLSKSRAAQELYDEIKSGLVTKMSWGFTVREESFDKDTLTWTIHKINRVYDVSAVSIPANADTEIAARSRLDQLKAQQIIARQRAIDILNFNMKIGG